MRFKLDENFGTRTRQLFVAAGHQVRTVRDQGLQGCSDERLYEACCEERFCLVTLDLDLANVTRFLPARSAGVIVIRVPRNPSLSLLERLIQQTLRAVARMPVEGKLWIVEADRIRMHEPETGEG